MLARLGAILLATLLVLSRTTTSAASIGSCLGPDELSNTLLKVAKVGVTSPALSFTRDSVLRVPAMDSSTISLVTTEADCALAAAAYDSAVVPSTPTASRGLYLLRLGIRYVAIDTATRFGGARFKAITLDSGFVVLAGPYGW